MSENLIHFYQTGTYTVGNRLLSPEERSGQAMMDRNNSLTSGHRACQGCGEALGARYAVDAAVRATGGNVAGNLELGLDQGDNLRRIPCDQRIADIG